MSQIIERNEDMGANSTLVETLQQYYRAGGERGGVEVNASVLKAWRPPMLGLYLICLLLVMELGHRY